MKKRKIAVLVVAWPVHLDELIEEATVDCHDDPSCRQPRKRRRGTRLNKR